MLPLPCRLRISPFGCELNAGVTPALPPPRSCRQVKWQRFARGTLVMLIILDILTFVPLVIVGMEIRLAREDRTWWLPYWVMTGALLQIGLDVL
jgi:hypothetical protein